MAEYLEIVVDHPLLVILLRRQSPRKPMPRLWIMRRRIDVVAVVIFVCLLGLRL
jgi:hypothetical protein